MDPSLHGNLCWYPPSVLECFSLHWADIMSHQSENKECRCAENICLKHGQYKVWDILKSFLNHLWIIIIWVWQMRFSTYATDPSQSSVFFLLHAHPLHFSRSAPEKQRPCIPKWTPLVRLFSSNTLFLWLRTHCCPLSAAVYGIRYAWNTLIWLRGFHMFSQQLLWFCGFKQILWASVCLSLCTRGAVCVRC